LLAGGGQVTCKLALYPHGLAYIPPKEPTKRQKTLLVFFIKEKKEPMISSLSFYIPIESNKQPKLGLSKYR
jgi:hypothetical protein